MFGYTVKEVCGGGWSCSSRADMTAFRLEALLDGLIPDRNRMSFSELCSYLLHHQSTGRTYRLKNRAQET